MDKLPTAVAPPTPKPAAAPAPAAEPKTPVTPAPAVEPTPKGRQEGEPKPGEKGYESFSDRIGRRVKDAEKAENDAKNPAAKAAADKAAADKVAADKAAADAAKAKTDELSEEQFKQAVETEAKGIKDPNAAKAWADLRYSERSLKRAAKDMVPAATVQKLETELSEARQQLEAAKTGPADPQQVADLKIEIEKLQKRDQERESELTVAKVERTEAFQNAVTKPRATVQKTVEALAKKYEIPARDLLDALTDTSDAQSDKLVELTEKMNRFDAAKIDNAVRDLMAITEKETTLRANAKEALEKVSTKTQTELDAQAKASRDARQAAHTPNWNKMKEELTDVLTPVEGDTDDVRTWNKAQTDAEVFARDTDFVALKPDIQAQTLQRAAVFPLLMGKLQSLEQQIVTEKEATQAALVRLEKFEKATPSGGADRQPGSDDADPAKGETDFVKRVGAKLDAAGIR